MECPTQTFGLRTGALGKIQPSFSIPKVRLTHRPWAVCKYIPAAEGFANSLAWEILTNEQVKDRDVPPTKKGLVNGIIVFFGDAVTMAQTQE
jgi:hypothetical protein